MLENNTANVSCDVSEIICGIVKRFKCIRDDVDISADLCSASIVANEEKLTVAFENIFDNALRFAESRICVSMKNDNGLEISIFNDGEHIENLTGIFKNMYKSKKGNFGLGLAITKKIISFYGGNISAVNTEDGVIFTICF